MSTNIRELLKITLLFLGISVGLYLIMGVIQFIDLKIIWGTITSFFTATWLYIKSLSFMSIVKIVTLTIDVILLLFLIFSYLPAVIEETTGIIDSTRKQNKKALEIFKEHVKNNLILENIEKIYSEDASKQLIQLRNILSEQVLVYNNTKLLDKVRYKKEKALVLGVVSNPDNVELFNNLVDISDTEETIYNISSNLSILPKRSTNIDLSNMHERTKEIINFKQNILETGKTSTLKRLTGLIKL